MLLDVEISFWWINVSDNFVVDINVCSYHYFEAVTKIFPRRLINSLHN